jgi:hypothetical protein
MRDFKADFAQGQLAANKVVAAKNEINGVLSQLNKDLFAASKGTITTAVQKLVEQPPSGMAGIRAAITGPSEPKYYWAIMTWNPKTKNAHFELARWQQHRNGYPCTVSWGGAEHQCLNREALEKCLGDLIRDAAVNLKFQILMKESPKTADTSHKAAPSTKLSTETGAPQSAPTTKPTPKK